VGAFARLLFEILALAADAARRARGDSSILTLTRCDSRGFPIRNGAFREDLASALRLK
jgi:hypothetical protein